MEASLVDRRVQEMRQQLPKWQVQQKDRKARRRQNAWKRENIRGAVIAAVKCLKVFIRAGGELNT